MALPVGARLCRGASLSDVQRIASSLGPVTWDPRHPEPVRFIHPQERLDATPNSLSSRHGTGMFPFHTDAAHWRHPPDYLLLYCCNPGGANRVSLLLEAAAL